MACLSTFADLAYKEYVSDFSNVIQDAVVSLSKSEFVLLLCITQFRVLGMNLILRNEKKILRES